MNPEILSEINGAKMPEGRKSFLKWLVQFEKENLERDRFPFKQEIQDEVKKYLSLDNLEKND